MQYGMDIKTYKRIEKRRDINLKLVLGNIVTVIFIGLMLGRVQFNFVEGLNISPFGIAYFLSVLLKKDFKKSSAAFVGILLGYLSILNFNKALYPYLFVAFAMLCYGYFISRSESKVNKNIIFIIIIGTYILTDLIFFGDISMLSFIFALIKSISIILTFYIVNYGISCASEINTSYLFSMEELISIAIVTCLVVAGIGSVEIGGILIRNLIALIMIIAIAYAGGSSSGAIMGITMGLIIGIANNDLVLAVALYGVCGLIVGVFRETGKIVSLIAYVVAYLIVSMYTSNIGIPNIIEVVISTIVLAILPMGVIKNLLLEMNNEEKVKVIDGIQIDGVKSEFVDRLESLKSVLGTISSSLSNLSENDRLLLKGKGTAMVENLADRVCANCELNRKCWQRELHSTFSSFGELIKSCEDKNPFFPKDLEQKCVKKNTLLKNAQELLSTYAVNEALKDRLIEGRRLIATQVNNMSLAINDIIRDFENDVSSCLEIDKLLRKTFTKNKIRYNSVYTYTDKKGRLKIKIKLDNLDGEPYCIKNILPVITDLVRMPLAISEEESSIDPKTNECSLIIEESQKYNIASYAAYTAKNGEKYSGDSFSFGKNKDGVYVTAVSDGMGSGPEAGLESGIAIELVEKFMESGFSEETALNTVNSIMSMKFNEEEKFTTLDMNAIDLYTGEASFIKVGGVVSFIKSGNEVEVIDSSTLPFGILDAVDIDIIKRKIKHGDIVVTISDGILDVDKSNVGDFSWLHQFLLNASNNPEVLSRDILEKAKELSNGKIFDDMTVVVSKAYSVY